MFQVSMTTTDAIFFNNDATFPATPGGAIHPNLLLVRWEMASRARNWPAALPVAKGLIGALPSEPIGWIYHGFAEQQMGRLIEARQTLIVAARRFPSDWRIAYNLACYSADLGDIAGAQNWLDRAKEIGDRQTVESCAASEESLLRLQVHTPEN